MIRRQTAIRGNAFTLVELLVVIAIVVVLISILLPVLWKVREKARITTCQSNIRQLCAAWINYATENGGEMIPALLWPINSPNPSWARQQNPETDACIKEGMLYRYVSNIKAFRCPDDPRENCLRTYAINDYMNGAGSFCRTIRNVTQARYPDRTFVFIEMPSSTGSFGGGNFTLDPGPPAGWIDPVCYWHGGTSLAFADGHCEYIKWADKRTFGLLPGALANGFPSYLPPLLQPNNPDLQRLASLVCPK